jgi:hypothetical protein
VDAATVFKVTELTEHPQHDEGKQQEKKTLSAKEKLIEACIASGKSKEECMKMMTDAFPQAADSHPATDAELRRETERQKAEILKLKEQQRQAIDIANKALDEKKARDEAERQTLITEITVDSNQKWSLDELKDKSLTELNLIKTTLTKSMDQTFASIAAYDAEQKRKTTPQLTVGYFAGRDAAGNAIYKGGI